jgi:hypothetical protein
MAPFVRIRDADGGQPRLRFRPHLGRRVAAAACPDDPRRCQALPGLGLALFVRPERHDMLGRIVATTIAESPRPLAPILPLVQAARYRARSCATARGVRARGESGHHANHPRHCVIRVEPRARLTRSDRA